MKAALSNFLSRKVAVDMAQMFFWLVCMQLGLQKVLLKCHRTALWASFWLRQAVLAITSGALNESGT